MIIVGIIQQTLLCDLMVMEMVYRIPANHAVDMNMYFVRIRPCIPNICGIIYIISSLQDCFAQTHKMMHVSNSLSK